MLRILTIAAVMVPIAEGLASADNPPAEGITAPSVPPSSSPNVAEDERRIGVGGDLLVATPIGDSFADNTGPLLGAALRLGYYAAPRGEVYLRVGYQHGLKKEERFLGEVYTSSLDIIPAYFGGRYFFMRPYAGLYGSAEFGMNVLRHKSDLARSSSTRFGFNLGAGYVLSKSVPINIGAQLSYFNLLGSSAWEPALIGANLQAGYEARF